MGVFKEYLKECKVDLMSEAEDGVERTALLFDCDGKEKGNCKVTSKNALKAVSAIKECGLTVECGDTIKVMEDCEITSEDADGNQTTKKIKKCVGKACLEANDKFPGGKKYRICKCEASDDVEC